MMKWVLILALVALLSWWLSRPRLPPRQKEAKREHIKMEKCPRCGVYIEAGKTCRCADTE